MEFINKGLKFVLEDFEKNCSDTDWVMGLNQANPSHCASCVVIGKSFAKRFPDNICFCPLYKVCGADNELWKFARDIKRAYLNQSEIVIAHNHTSDLTAQTAWGEGRRAADKELFKQRQVTGLLWGKKT